MEEKTKRGRRALTIKELRHKERMQEVGKTSPGVVVLGEDIENQVDENRSAYEIIREWHEPPEDEVLSLATKYSLSNDPT